MEYKLWKINQKLEIFWKYIENKSDWKVQWEMPSMMYSNWDQKGCLKSYWYIYSLQLRCKSLFLVNIECTFNNGRFWPPTWSNALTIYTSNFSDTPFGPDYCISSIAYLTAPSNQPNFYCMVTPQNVYILIIL